MGFNVFNLYAEIAGHTCECGDLILQQRYKLHWRYFHRAAAKAGDIWVTWMGPYHDVVAFGGEQGFFDYHWVAGMKTTGDIGLVDKWHYLIIEAHFPGAEAFAEVAI
jgi:hypothetical protein